MDVPDVKCRNQIALGVSQGFFSGRGIEEGRLEVICAAKTLNLFRCSCRLDIARAYSIAVVKAAASGGDGGGCGGAAKSSGDLVHCVAQMVVYCSNAGEVELCRWNSACKDLEPHSE